MPPAEPAVGQPRGGAASLLPVSAGRYALQRAEELPSVLRPLQDSYERGSCKTGSRGRGDEPLQCVLRIVGIRHGHPHPRDARVAMTMRPLASMWPTVR